MATRLVAVTTKITQDDHDALIKIAGSTGVSAYLRHCIEHLLANRRTRVNPPCQRPEARPTIKGVALHAP